MALSNPQRDIFDSCKNINLFMAGVGSGKSFLGGVISSALITHFPQSRGFIGANTYDQLTTSTLVQIRKSWKLFHGWQHDRDYVVGIKPPTHFNTKDHEFDDYHSIISFKNGGVIFKGSLDNYKTHEGKEFAWGILDETKDTKEEAVKEVILARLRQMGMYLSGNDITNVKNKHPFNPLYILTSPAKVDWINDWFMLDQYTDEITDKIYSKTEYFKKEYPDKFATISSTYLNERNLPTNYIQRIIDNNTKEIASRLIYGNPFVKTGGEFYSSFDRMKHVKSTKFIEDQPIHISFDQNVVPYVTLKCYQVVKINEVWQERHFDEICLSNPKNTTEAVCYEFIRKYGSQIKGLFYYGDATGRHRDTRGRENDYTIIEKLLRKYLNNFSDRVNYKNPSVLKRRDFANNCFEDKYNIRIMIDPKCKNTIADYTYLKQDINGKKLKEKVADKASKQSYEKYGHCSDADDYFRVKIFEKIFHKEFAN